MNKTLLHITNGNCLTSYLKELSIEGDILTWQEMLCEGPTTKIVYSNEFLKLRQTFFNTFYDIDLDIEAIKSELKKLDNSTNYSEIILWFEYDLFCHINLLAVINLIQQKKIITPLYLVCSGRVKGNKTLKGLSELSPDELLKHYKNKVLINQDAIKIASNVWEIYCGSNHNLLKPYIIKPSVFMYLSICLKAHLERFPDLKDGLNVLERNILKIINQYKITSKNQLLGYAINYQGFYGYGDLQLLRIINNLSTFYSIENKRLVLNRKGHEALLGQQNFSSEINDKITFGGIKKRSYQFCNAQNKLIKSV